MRVNASPCDIIFVVINDEGTVYEAEAFETLLVSFINSRWELPHPANASQRIYTHAA